MILYKMKRYAIAVTVVFTVLLIASAIDHWDVISEYYRDALGDFFSMLIYILIILSGIVLIFKALLFRRK